MNSLELDQEIGKMAVAMMTRNSAIGKALIAHLRTQMTLESVAGVLLVSIQRVVWFDTDSVVWTMKYLIPTDVMEEIQRMTSFSVYKHLVGKGFVPGKDLSVDADGKLLLKAVAKIPV